MPCDQVRTVSLDMTKAQPDTLKAALESLGCRVEVSGSRFDIYKDYSYVGSWQPGSNLNVYEGRGIDAESVNNALAATAIKKSLAAKHANWSVKQVSPTKFVLKARR